MCCVYTWVCPCTSVCASAVCGWRAERAAVCIPIPRAPRTPEEGPLSHLRGPRGCSPAPVAAGGGPGGGPGAWDLVLSHLGLPGCGCCSGLPAQEAGLACVIVCSGSISLKGGAWGVQRPWIWAWVWGPVWQAAWPWEAQCRSLVVMCSAGTFLEGLGAEVIEAPGILDALALGLAGGSGQRIRDLGEGV